MSVVEELCDVEGTAGGPGGGPAQVQDHGGHEVLAPQGPKQPLTGLGVIMGHAQHMACTRAADTRAPHPSTSQ